MKVYDFLYVCAREGLHVMAFGGVLDDDNHTSDTSNRRLHSKEPMRKNQLSLSEWRMTMHDKAIYRF